MTALIARLKRLQSFTKVKDKVGHEHANDGKFTSTGGGASKPEAKPADKPAADAPSEKSGEKAKGVLAKMGGKLSAMADKIPVVGHLKRGMEKAMGKIHDVAAQRYGPKTAKAIMASGVVADAVLMGGGALLAGMPIVTGANQLIGIIPAFVLAEAKYQVGKLMGKSVDDLQGGEFDAACKDVARMIRKAFKGLLAKHGPELATALKGEKTLSRLRGVFKNWEEDKHPRADDGKFGSGSGQAQAKPAGKEKPAPKDEPKPAAEAKPQADPGDRPKRPEKWESEQQIADYAAKMSDAINTDPRVKQLRKDYAIAQDFFNMLAKKDVTKMPHDEWQRHVNTKLDLSEDMRKTKDAIHAEERRVMAKSFAVEDKATINVAADRPKGAQAKAFNEAKEYLQSIMSYAAVGEQSVKVKATASRAYYNQGEVRLTSSDDAGTAAHEFGHHLNEMDWVKERVNAFRAKRFTPDKKVNLSTTYPQYGYGQNEWGNPDDMEKLFPGKPADAAYIGKLYSDGQTEIVSMGLELLYRNPVHFAKTDPEYFSLIIGIIQKGKS
jgi:hypothetical protein